jgi:ketosteroid isomerase-like protein
MPSPYDATRLTTLGHEWIAAWNRRDLDRVLALYAEDFEMTSEHIHAMGFDASGTLRGKSRVSELLGDRAGHLVGVERAPHRTASW